jgi:hypothetical protein
MAYIEAIDGYKSEKVLHRWDAWFQCEEIFAFAEKRNEKFLFRIKNNGILTKAIENLVENTIFDRSQRFKFVFNYQSKSWSQARTVVCEYIPSKETWTLFAEYQFFCTNVFWWNAWDYSQDDAIKVINLYHERGTAEHPFHDFKENFQAWQTNAQSFYVNEFKFLTSILSMQIYIVFRELYLQGTTIAKSYFWTIARRVIIVWAKIVKTWRKVFIKLKEWTKKSFVRKHILNVMDASRV